MTLELAVIGAWLAIAWLVLALAATRRQMRTYMSAPSRRPATVSRDDATGLTVPGIAVIVRPACVTCTHALNELAGSDLRATRALTVVSAGDDVGHLGLRVLVAPRLVQALTPPAYPWVVALDGQLRVVEYEAFTSVTRLAEMGSTDLPAAEPA